MSCNTISAIENGKTVNSEALLAVLAQSNLLQPLTEAVEQQLAFVQQWQTNRRKRSKPKAELPNDF
ncbi:MAG: hypothetical protein KJ888_05010 [Gammaproteobacteria bacterium]|nr:hypothetical protein [Gammaproteobacteria bacterium]MBU2246686.1 hypothetical protein [Gammaproteobacteria bacterium]MBU2343560.1 hypothetical protein [Gammaproteobacteria bacterium]